MTLASPTLSHAARPATPSPADAPAAAAVAHLATLLQAAAFAQPDAQTAASVVMAELALRLAHDRVGIGLAHGTRVEITASSDPSLVADADAADAGAECLRAALAEALDQRATLLQPELRAQAQPRITLAQRRLLDAAGGSVVTVPIVVDAVCVGAVCAERHGGRSMTLDDVAAFEQLVGQLGPVLQLMALNARPLHKRLAAWPREAWQRLQRPGSHGRARWALAGAAALAVLTLIPVDQQIGGHARLEGAVQRVLVAPADGFLGQVHVRPGDLVRAGQVLVELADRDLQLDAQRWQSQLAQYEDAYAAANARADRTQLVINRSRAAEAEAQLALATTKLARSRIEAPFDAVVIQGDLSQSLGAPVQQGAELLTLAPRDDFRVIVEVDERDIAALRVGQPGTLALSALPWQTLPIRVKRITPVATAVEGRNVFEVEAALPAPPADLRPGLQGQAHIVAGRQSLLWRWLRPPVDALRLWLWEWLG